MNNEIIVTDGVSPIISQPSSVLVGGEPSVVVQENFVGGQNATIQIGSVETLPAGSQAYVNNVGTETHAVLNFGLVTGNTGASGSDGADGSDGQAATINVGTVTTGLPNTNVVITNVGTPQNAVFDFTIPRGSQGVQGIQGVAGQDGISPRAYVEPITGGARVVIEDSQNTTTANIMDGTDGTDGFSPVATVTPTSSGATISITDSQGTTTANITNGTDGTDGTDGITPSITATASVDNTTGTPSVIVTKSGTDVNPSFAFAFSNLKGADGTTPTMETVALSSYITPASGFTFNDDGCRRFGKMTILNFNFSGSVSTGENVAGTCSNKFLCNTYGSGRTASYLGTNRGATAMCIPNGQFRIYADANNTAGAFTIVLIEP